MKSLNRQKIEIYYSNYLSNVDVVDSNGNYTGEKEMSYSTPTKVYVTISPKGGDITLQPFGSELDYTSTIISDSVTCPIDENSRIWIDNITDDDNDYVVVGIYKTLNFVSYAIKKVQ